MRVKPYKPVYGHVFKLRNATLLGFFKHKLLYHKSVTKSKISCGALLPWGAWRPEQISDAVKRTLPKGKVRVQSTRLQELSSCSCVLLYHICFEFSIDFLCKVSKILWEKFKKALDFSKKICYTLFRAWRDGWVGLRRTTGNRVCTDTASRVRIPISPPKNPYPIRGMDFFFWRWDRIDSNPLRVAELGFDCSPQSNRRLRAGGKAKQLRA